MRIIEGPETWAKKFRCRECHSLLEVELEDIGIGNYGVNWGVPETELRFYFRCPVCESMRFVDRLELPDGFRHRMIKEWHKDRVERPR